MLLQQTLNETEIEFQNFFILTNNIDLFCVEKVNRTKPSPSLRVPWW